MLSVCVCLVLAALGTASQAAISVQLSDHVEFVTDERFKCWTVDASSNRGFFQRTLNTSKLAYLAQESAPGLIRFGGSGNDEMSYGVGLYPDGVCPFPGNCLNETRFRDFLGFIRSSGAQFVFGVNVMKRMNQTAANPEGVWNDTETRAVLNWMIEHDQADLLYGVENGNEQNGRFTGQGNAENTAQAYSLLKELFPFNTPILAGPDPDTIHMYQEPSAQHLLDYMLNFSVRCQELGVPLHAVTIHEYIEVDDTAATVLNPAFLNHTYNIADAVNATLYEPFVVKTGGQLWAGEIGPHNGGSPGCGNTNRYDLFGDALWYADAMAVKAKKHFSVFCRQDFVGIDYGLVDCATNVPKPDYYVGWLWSRLMGRSVLLADAAAAPPTLRMYAHCAPDGGVGGVTVLLISLEPKDSLAVELPFPNADAYVLTPPDGNLGSSTANLNGNSLKFDTTAWRLPALTPAPVAGSSATVPPMSVSFYSFPKAGYAPCKGSP